MKEFIFSYGTLQQPKTQLEIFGRLLGGTPDRLEGYRLLNVEIKDQRFLARGEEKFQSTLVCTNYSGDHVDGMVFGIDQDELKFTDQYEPGNYQRLKVTLRSGKEAWIYLAV